MGKRLQQYLFTKIIFILGLLYAIRPGLIAGEEKPHEDPTRSCTSTECHVEQVKHTFLHGPLAVRHCFPCHAPVPPLPGEDKHKFKILDSIPTLCFTCHKDIDLEKVLHEPISKGECLKCHSPHGSEKKSQLLSDSTGTICLSCHDDLIKKPIVHGPIEQDSCTACHLSHGNAKMLLRKETTGLKGCIHCHNDKRSILAPQSTQTVHEPVKEDCRKCHRVHDSDFKGLLNDSIPALCFSCHENQKETIGNAKFTHNALYAEKGCLNCHFNHYSSNEKLLREKDALLCFSCHEELQEQVKNMPYKHEPVDSMGCRNCHKTHSSEYHRLLKSFLWPGFYAPYRDSAYSVCFECHESKLVKEELTLDATEFRTGNRNLHFVHVNKEKKGRTCRSCHASHVALNKPLIRSEVPFGDWNIPINFEKTENGGSCNAGCHIKQVYDRTDFTVIDTSTREQLLIIPDEGN